MKIVNATWQIAACLSKSFVLLVPLSKETTVTAFWISDPLLKIQKYYPRCPYLRRSLIVPQVAQNITPCTTPNNKLSKRHANWQSNIFNRTNLSRKKKSHEQDSRYSNSSDMKIDDNMSQLFEKLFNPSLLVAGTSSQQHNHSNIINEETTAYDSFPIHS